MKIDNKENRAFIIQTAKDYEISKSEVKRIYNISETYADFYHKLETILQDRKNNV